MAPQVQLKFKTMAHNVKFLGLILLLLLAVIHRPQAFLMQVALSHVIKRVSRGEGERSSKLAQSQTCCRGAGGYV